MKLFILIILGPLLLLSCGAKINKAPKTDNKNVDNNQTETPWVDPSPKDEPEATPCGDDCDLNTGNWEKKGDSEGRLGRLDYVTIDSIIGHGIKNAPKDKVTNPVILKSNKILKFDTRFYLRIKVLKAPARGEKDRYGNKCEMEPIPYKKLSVSVALRDADKPTSELDDQYTFKEIPVDGISKIYKFKVPVAEAVKLDIFDVKWDYWGSIGISTEHGPMHAVWHRDCIQIAVQYATDATLKLPGPTIN